MAPRTPQQKRWAEENAEYLKAYKREYHKKHRKRYRDHLRAWVKKNPERNKLLKKVSVANRLYPDKITLGDVLAVLEASGRKCYWCGKEGLSGRDLTLEHLQPFNRRECLAISCLSCNASRIPTHGPKKTEDEKQAQRRAANKRWYYANLDEARRRAREWAQAQRKKAKRFDAMMKRKRTHGDC